MKIKRTNLRKLRNNEHFQLQTEFRTLVEEFGSETLKIGQLFDENYSPLYEEEDEAVIKIMKNSFTGQREIADQQRDTTFRGMAATNNAALKHFDPAVVRSAGHLKILFDTYGNIAELPFQEETSAIYNLLQELRGKYLEDTQIVGITGWVDKLASDNNVYDALTKQGYDEDANRTQLKMKEVRLKIDKIFHNIIERLEALMLIEGEEDYAAFVRRLNIVLEKYNNILAQRRGSAAAGK